MTSYTAVEILEAINEHFQEQDGSLTPVLYGDAQILDSDISIKDAVAECLKPAEAEEPIVPHSQRRKVGKNFYGDWNGFIGSRKVIWFGPDEQAAHAWVHGGQVPDTAIYDAEGIPCHRSSTD